MELNLKNDIIFKIFFAKKGNEEFLIDFLEALLKVKIKTIKIGQEVDLGKLAKNEKTGRLDLQAILNDNTMVDIEMQIKNRHNIVTRSVFYGAKQLSGMTEKGTDYGSIKKVILINILDYEFLPFEEYVSNTVMVLDKHREYEITDKIKFYYIELPKFRKKCPDMGEKINQWLAFIDDKDRGRIEMAEARNKVLRKARQEMEYLTGDEETKRLEYLKEKWEMDYNSDINWARKEGMAEGEEKGEKRGKKAGIKETQLEIAKKMLAKGKEITEIIEMTELTEEEIENLQKEI